VVVSDPRVPRRVYAKFDFDRRLQWSSTALGSGGVVGDGAELSAPTMIVICVADDHRDPRRSLAMCSRRLHHASRCG